MLRYAPLWCWVEGSAHEPWHLPVETRRTPVETTSQALPVMSWKPVRPSMELLGVHPTSGVHSYWAVGRRPPASGRGTAVPSPLIHWGRDVFSAVLPCEGATSCACIRVLGRRHQVLS